MFFYYLFSTKPLYLKLREIWISERRHPLTLDIDPVERKKKIARLCVVMQMGNASGIVRRRRSVNNENEHIASMLCI